MNISTAQAWMTEKALPLWANNGYDRIYNQFHERLTFDGAPILDAPYRLMVQCRQIYVYSTAYLAQWHNDSDLVEQAYNSLKTNYFEADGAPGWISAISRDGVILDKSRDLYAHAFVLFGLASYYKLSQDRSVLNLVEKTLSFLDAHFVSSHGGFVDALPRMDDIRRQNPHMHLFEAFTALFEATGDEKFARRANSLRDLFERFFFDSRSATVVEYLDERLSPLNGVKGTIREPGHAYEWAWLLGRHEAARGQAIGSLPRLLVESADKMGWSSGGLIYSEISDTGTVVDSTARIWPLTEAMKAHVLFARDTGDKSGRKIAAILDKLATNFLSKTVDGGWVDKLDASGEISTHFMPASTLYHLSCAFKEISMLQSVVNGKERSEAAYTGDRI